MKRRTLGDGFELSAIGLGCMGMSEFYGESNDEDSIATIRRALDIGVSFLDTSDMYGSGHNENLVGRAVAGRREEAQIATKFGIRRDGGERRIDNSPEWIREACEGSCAGSASIGSISTTCTAALPTCRSRRASEQWRSSSARARWPTSASAR
jgi:aryl-alcohol dehydrogenase-like predicted oxidoreductase